MLSTLLHITQAMSVDPTRSVTEAVAHVLEEKRRTCASSWSQVVRRFHRVAKAVWGEVCTSPPPIGPRLHRPEARTERVFTDDEIGSLLVHAPRVSVYAPALIRLLFTTGLRIAAAVRLRWDAVANGSAVAVVREKGNRWRCFPLAPTVRNALQELHAHRKRPDDPRVFAITCRQARNIFYAVCHAADVRRPHCHPHAARHTLVHQLFAVGNPLALIAKFLGHTTIQTTERYYLRLSYRETMERIRLPWLVNAAAGTQTTFAACAKPRSPLG